MYVEVGVGDLCNGVLVYCCGYVGGLCGIVDCGVEEVGVGVCIKCCGVLVIGLCEVVDCCGFVIIGDCVVVYGGGC